MTPATLIAGLAGLTLIATGAAASPGGKHAGKMMFGPTASFEALDANTDGQLSQPELEAHFKARFQATDANQDGFVTAPELAQKFAPKGGKRARKGSERLLRRLDRDQDGKLSYGEMSKGRSGKLFARIDANQDGAISAGEFEQASQARKAKWKEAQRKTRAAKDAETGPQN